ncbi:MULTISPECIES: O-antigen polymerase [Gammaproteobacteria]|uniref:O-antigen polymerase n=1 Tax=Gammaproteobacteria TaxID=1236 RepID=UPI001267B597|nr:MULTISPECIES: O-antigen polymerase [Gammaproteobacteria]MCE9679176.1 oligosaccharide repeat unit polymerase [Shewanella sp. AS1]
MRNSVVFKLVVFQAIIRYSLIPIFIIHDQYLKVGFESRYTNIAIIVSVLEIVSIFLIFEIFSKKQESVIRRVNRTIQPVENYTIVSFLLLVIFCYLYYTGSFEVVNFIWNLGDYVSKYVTGEDEINSNKFGAVLLTPFKIILSLLAISIIYNSSKVINKSYYYLLVVFFSSLFIVGTSRFSVVLFSLPLVVLISQMVEPKDIRKILIFTLFIFVFMIVITTLAKFSKYGNTLTLNSIVTASTLNAYFSGVGNVSLGFEAYDELTIDDSILYLVNDTFQNIPILSKLTYDNYKGTIKFNEFIYQHRDYADQIIPLSISGLFHFGYIGLFFYSSFFVTIALYFERCALKINYIGYKYIYISLASTFSLVFMLNIGSFYAYISRTILFVFVPILIIKLLARFLFKAFK